MPKQFRLTPPKISENDVEFGCMQVLQYRGYRPIRLHAGRWRSPDLKYWIKGVDMGTPDYICIHPKYPAIYVETKRPGGKLSPEQEQKIWEIKEGYHLHVAVVDSPGALTELLNQHEQRATTAWLKLGVSSEDS